MLSSSLVLCVALLQPRAAAETPASPTKVVTSLPGFNIRAAVFSRDGLLLATGSGPGVTVWDALSGVQKAFLPGKEADNGLSSPLAISPDGKLLVAEWRRFAYRAGRTKQDIIRDIVLFDIEKAKLVRKLLKRKDPCHETGNGFIPFICGEVRSGGFSPDGKRFTLTVDRAPAEYFVIDVGGGSKKLPGEAAFAADGRLLVVVAKDYICPLKDGDTDKVIGGLQRCAVEPTAGYSDGETVFSRDGSVILRHGLKRLTAWQTNSGRVLLFQDVTNISHKFSVTSDGSRLYGTFQPENSAITMRVWDLRSGALLEQRPVLDTEFALSPDERYILVPQKAEPFGVELREHVPPGGAPAPALPVAAAASPPIDVDVPPSAKTPVDPEAYAVVIGIEKYRQNGLPAVDFAARDAQTVARYLTGAMGFDSKNVVVLENEQATKTDLEKYLGPWLANRATDKSRVFVYFAGHGAPNPKTGEGFLIPYEGDPSYTEVTAYPLSRLYSALAALPTRDVTVVLDSCFSGQGGRSVIAKGARPLVTVQEQRGGDNTVVLTAASSSQVSASLPERRHGILTYFLLEGLHGAADADKDGAITTAELYTYLRPAVEREARKQNLEQTPSISPSLDSLRIRAGRPWLQSTRP